jgi:hypothetical protein
MQPDNETKKNIWEHEELARMCEGDGWRLARQRLVDKVIELSDIMELDEEDPTKLSFRLAVNREAIKILLGWLNNIEGEKANTNVNEMLKKEKTESYMRIIE